MGSYSMELSSERKNTNVNINKLLNAWQGDGAKGFADKNHQTQTGVGTIIDKIDQLEKQVSNLRRSLERARVEYENEQKMKLMNRVNR